MYRTPHRRVTFFEQAVLQQYFSQQLFELTRLRLDRLDLVAGRFTGSVACQPLLAGLQEVLRPAVIEILVDALLATQLGDAVFATQPRNHNPDLLFRRVLPPRRPSYIANCLLCRLGLLLCFRSHRRSFAVKMSSISSLPQSRPSVQLVLTGNNLGK